MTTRTEAELAALLRHPDAFVRSLADWTKAYRGWGWRNIAPHVATADTYETRLTARLEALHKLGLTSSDAYTLAPRREITNDYDTHRSNYPSHADWTDSHINRWEDFRS